MAGSKKKAKNHSASRSLAGFYSKLPLLAHLVFASFLLYWFRIYLGDSWVATVDLPGHITVIERLADQILSLRLRFYDPDWFSGWPAFQFYAPLSHLLAAIISLPLSSVSQESARLSAHLIILGSLVSLAPLFHYFTKCIIRSFPEIRRESDLGLENVLALTSIALAFWFINHDRQWYGIGAAAVLHVGLFSQALAWPILIYYLAKLATACRIETKREERRVHLALAISYSILFLTHSLTAAFGLFVALVFFLLQSRVRQLLVLSHLHAFLLAGFWFIPFALYSPSYLGLDIYRPTGDFLELLLRYPIVGIIQSVYSFLHVAELNLEFTSIVVLFLLAACFFWTRLHTSKAFVTFGVAILLGLLVFSSGFVASSIPIGLHYYRFYAYLFLLISVLLVSVPALYIVTTKYKKTSICLIALFSVSSLISNVNYPHYEREKISKLVGLEQFSEEQQVLAYLKREPAVGRVYFSYFADYKIYPFLSAHFFTSQLKGRNQQETLNGLFIQSSLAYRMPVASAALLGIPGYHTPLLFTDDAKLTSQVMFEQLLDVGVTHVVLGRKNLREALSSRAQGRIHFVGPYAIVRIAKEVRPIVTEVKKPVVGYLSIDNTIPFHLFEMYFYSKASLYSHFELLELKSGDLLPPGLSALVVNGMPSDERIKSILANASKLPPSIRISHNPNYTLNHYSVWYQHNVELDSYKAIVKTLDKEMNFVSRLLSVPRRVRKDKASGEPKFAMSNNGQQMDLSELKPGVLYRINYSYFPYWSANDALIYRGMPERIFIVPSKTKATLEYRLFSKRSTWIGYFLSIFATVWLYLIWIKTR